MSINATSRRRLRGLILLLGTVVIFAASLTHLLHDSRRYRDRRWSRTRLGHIWRGLRAYDEEYGRLPPATDANGGAAKAKSWRVSVYESLLHIGYFAASDPSLSYDHTRHWNDPMNLQLEKRGWLFQRPHREIDERNMTFYKAVTGPGTAFDCAKTASLDELPSELILVVRVESSATHWMQPGDLAISDLAPSDETKQLLAGKTGYAVLFADGEAWTLSADLPIPNLCTFLTIDGAIRHCRDQMLGPYRVFQ